jgi:large subunit ribosomal protein L18
MAVRNQKELRERRHASLRRKLAGTPERPRLAVFRSLQHISVQLIDDEARVTIASASTMEKDLKAGYGGNVKAAEVVGKLISERAKEKGVKSIVFDRGGYQYRGRVKALAEAVRAAGLEF